MTKRCDALVLDLDDTLYSERQFHESGFRWIARNYGIDPHGPFIQAANRALRTGGQPLQILSEATQVPVAQLLEDHRNHLPEISLYPDARRLLQRAIRAEFVLAILTDGRSSTQMNKVRALRLAKIIDYILISEETGVDKTHLRAFINVEEKLRHRSSAITYVGDNPRKDISHPLRLGWDVYLLAGRGDNVHAQTFEPKERALKIINSLDEIPIGRPFGG